MTCTATTENVAFEATNHETEQLTGTSYAGILLLQGRGGTLIDPQPEVEQLTATDYLVKVTVKNPTDVRITDGGLAMSNNLDVVSAGSNFGEIYGNSQGFLFKYTEEIFWRFIVRWTEGLEGDYDASGWWLNVASGLQDHKWETPSTVLESPASDCAMAVSWQGMEIEAGGQVNVSFIVGAGYRGYNQPLPSPPSRTTVPRSPMASKLATSVFTESEQVAAPTFASPASQEPNVSEVFKNATQDFQPSEGAWESELVLTQVGPTEVGATGAVVEATTEGRRSNFLPPESGEFGARMGDNQSVFEYSEVNASVQDPTVVLVTGRADVATSDVPKPSGVETLTVQARESGDALASGEEESQWPASEVLVSDGLSTVKFEKTSEDSESRTVTTTSDDVVRPSLGDLSTVSWAPSKTFGPTAVPGQTDASEATELVSRSVREQRSATRRGSGPPVERTPWFDGSGSTGGSRAERPSEVKERTDTAGRQEVGGSDSVEETVIVRMTREVVHSVRPVGTVMDRTSDRPPSRDFVQSESLLSGIPQVEAATSRAMTGWRLIRVRSRHRVWRARTGAWQARRRRHRGFRRRKDIQQLRFSTR
jgi:hypothetical protein